jgi:undecaprenyl-diphosphatase
MNIINSIILGIVEGATEYLPISSTFHLIWTSKILGIPQTEFQKAYEVIIQGGAILAVFILYWKTFLTDIKLVTKIICSFLVTGSIGFVLYEVIKNTFFESYQIQLLIFTLVGLFFIFFEYYHQKKTLSKTLSDLTYKDAIIIGFVQVLAVFPGVSRAGAVLVGMMYLGIKRVDSAKYSFLLAVPTLAAAAILDIYKSLPVLISNSQNFNLLIVGFIASFLSAIVFVKWFVNFLQKNNLNFFAYYRISVVIILVFFFSQLIQ